MLIDGRDAWHNASANRHSRWNHVADRFDAEFMSIFAEPKFEISQSDRVFCIGSCFARNVEEHMIYRDFDVLSKKIVSPKSEFGNRPTGIVNKYTTHSILNEIAWLGQAPNWQDILVQSAEGWMDFQLHTDAPVSISRALERRKYINEEYFTRIADASLLIITLGLIETWYDSHSGAHLNVSPSFALIKGYPGRFQMKRTTVAENYDNLVEIRRHVKNVSPKCKMIITVSPVAMAATFSGEDVVQANTYSKSVLRVAAQQLVDAYDDIDYFPSYELAMMSPRAKAFHKDCLHVSEFAIRRIIDAFITTRAGSIPYRFPNFLEKSYLKANPDVMELVRSGQIPSGYHHWISCGQREGRQT